MKRNLLPPSITRNWDLYLMILPVVVYFIVFKYVPMYGIQIAFKNYSGAKGIWGSAWVGFEHFIRFFKSFQFLRVVQNTVGISMYSLLVGFPIPIILALMLNDVKNKYYKKSVQLVTYAPHFISTVVLCGMITAFLSPSTGIINNIIKLLGYKPIYFMTEASMFKTIYVVSGVWQNMGWNSIIYIAALSGIDLELYEAATVDGASKLQKLLHISLPGILPTAIIMFILNLGNVMDVGFEKVFLLQTSLNKPSSEVISTYVYSVGLLGAQFSFTTAVGLFNSVINFALLIIVNKLAKALSDTSLW